MAAGLDMIVLAIMLPVARVVGAGAGICNAWTRTGITGVSNASLCP